MNLVGKRTRISKFADFSSTGFSLWNLGLARPKPAQAEAYATQRKKQFAHFSAAEHAHRSFFHHTRHYKFGHPQTDPRLAIFHRSLLRRRIRRGIEPALTGTIRHAGPNRGQRRSHRIGKGIRAALFAAPIPPTEVRFVNSCDNFPFAG